MFQPFHFDDSISPFSDQVNFRSSSFSANDLRSDTQITTSTRFYCPRDYTDNVVSRYGDSERFYSNSNDLHDALNPLGNRAP